MLLICNNNKDAISRIVPAMGEIYSGLGIYEPFNVIFGKRTPYDEAVLLGHPISGFTPIIGNGLVTIAHGEWVSRFTGDSFSRAVEVHELARCAGADFAQPFDSVSEVLSDEEVFSIYFNHPICYSPLEWIHPRNIKGQDVYRGVHDQEVGGDNHGKL